MSCTSILYSYKTLKIQFRFVNIFSVKIKAMNVNSTKEKTSSIFWLYQKQSFLYSNLCIAGKTYDTHTF